MTDHLVLQAHQVLGVCTEPVLPNQYNTGLVVWNLHAARNLKRPWIDTVVSSAMKWGDDPEQFYPAKFTDFPKLMDQSVFYSICRENGVLCRVLAASHQALGQQWTHYSENDRPFLVHYNAASLNTVRTEAVLTSPLWKWILGVTDTFCSLPLNQIGSRQPPCHLRGK